MAEPTSLREARDASIGAVDLKIMRKATQLFATRGFHAVGIRAIASECDLSLSSLYHYMPSKDHLLERIMSTTQEVFLAEARKVYVEHRDPVENLAAIVTLNIAFHIRSPLTTRVNEYEMDSLSADARGRIITLRDGYDALWDSLIQSGTDSGLFVVENPRITRIALLGMFAQVVSWYSSDGPLTVDDVCLIYIRMAFKLLGVPTERQGAGTALLEQFDLCGPTTIFIAEPR